MADLPLLVKLGVIELTVGVLTGWLMVYAADSDRRRSGGIVAGQRIRQGHIDLLMMGTILIAVGAAVPDPPALAVVLVTTGSVIAPLLFFPLAWWPQVAERRWHRWLDRCGFVTLSFGYVLLSFTVIAA